MYVSVSMCYVMNWQLVQTVPSRLVLATRDPDEEKQLQKIDGWLFDHLQYMETVGGL